MSSPIRRLSNNNKPSDRQLRRVWADSGWCQIGEGWTPVGVDNDERIAVQEAAGGWRVLLDGSLVHERDGSVLLWPDRYAAGCHALRLLEHRWHGGGRRFDPARPWQDRRGFWMRPLVGAYLTARGHPIQIDVDCIVETPVAVVREWQWPCDHGWGVFVGSAQRHALRTVSNLMHFKSADDARAAADSEVGRWVMTEEWDTLNWRRKRPKRWWPPHD